MYFEIAGTQLRLLGSMHRFPASATDMPNWICRAYEWCEELNFEADAADALRYFFIPKRALLRTRLSAESWEAMTRN